MSSYARFAGITGAAADLVASRKEAKYTSGNEPHQLVYFQPIAVESHGAFRSSGLSFVTSYHFGKTLDRHFWRLARDTSLVSKTVDHHATIQYRFKISHEGFVSADEIPPFRYSNF